MSRSLTRAEAIERAQLVSDPRASVKLELGLGETFASTTELSFAAPAGATTFLDVDTTNCRAVLNGAPIDQADIADGRIVLRDLAEQNSVLVQATMSYAHDGEGMHRHDDPADGQTYLYAMSFLDAAPRWLACFDQPDLKTRFSIEVTTPHDDWIVRGNTPARQRGRVWTMPEGHPLASYLVTVVAGPYRSLEQHHDGIRLELLARASMAAELDRAADDLFATTRHCFDAYHDLFGHRYAFGDYVQAFIPDFNAGAMEKPGCVLVREQMLFRGAATAAEHDSRAGLVAHEMAHQWFGDLVTMRWWDDLWLNESFAEYLAHRVITASGRTNLWLDFGLARKNWGAEADQGPASHPVAGNGADDAHAALLNFDGISYAKGAAALRQLAIWLGDDVFLGGLRSYIARFAHANATLADLMACWVEAGAPADALGDWSQHWLQRQGMDLLSAEMDADQVVLHRDSPHDWPADRHHAITLSLLSSDGQELGSQAMVVTADRTELGLPDLAGSDHDHLDAELVEKVLVVPDAHDQTWARIRSSVPLADLPPLSSIANPATRVSLTNALRDGLRHGELSHHDALAAALATLPHETEPVISAETLRWALELARVWHPAPERTGALAALAQVASDLLVRAPSGGDQQLAALRTWVAATTDQPRLFALLDGDDATEGIEVDQELRWQVVQRLVALGHDLDLAEAEHRRDPSSTGRIAWRAATALVPSAAAKAAAAEQVATGRDGDQSLGTHEVMALAAALFHPEHTAHTDALVDQWPAMAHQVVTHHAGWLLPRLALALAPLSHASPETHAMLLGLATAPELAPLARPLAESAARIDQIVTTQSQSD